MTDYTRFETSSPISLVSKRGVLIQSILDVLSLRTRHTIESMKLLSNNEISLTNQYSVNGLFSELIL